MIAKKMTCRQIERYQSYLIQEEKSPLTIEKYTRDVMKFYDFLPAGKRISREVILTYKEALVKNYKAVSVNSMLAALNSFLSFRGMDCWRVKSLKIQRQLFARADRELNRKEYKQLLDTARKNGNERLFLILQTIGATGIRISELSYITAESLEAGRAEVNCKNKTRIIWLPEKLLDILKQYIKRNKIEKGPVFISRNQNVLHRNQIWADMKKLAVAAEVDSSKVFPHNLRHLFARMYYQKEKDVVKLGDLLGHSSIETTRIYTITSGNEHVRQLNELGLIV